MTSIVSNQRLIRNHNVFLIGWTITILTVIVSISQHICLTEDTNNDEELKEEYPDIEYKRELKECTFTPGLNKETYRIVSNQDDRDTFNTLYSQAQIISKQKEDLLKETEEQRIQDEIGQCTFKPNISPLEGLDLDIQVQENEYKIEERALKYVQERNKRIEENEKEKANELDEECTFQPKTYQRKPYDLDIEKHINVQSIDKHLERMMIAKEKKSNIEKQWSDKVGSGKHWKGEMTIPKAPQLVNRMKYGKGTKALDKPVSIHETVGNIEASTSSLKRHNNYPQTVIAQEIESKSSQAKLLMKKKNEKENELLKIGDKLDYESAQWKIHNYILALDV